MSAASLAKVIRPETADPPLAPALAEDAAQQSTDGSHLPKPTLAGT